MRNSVQGALRAKIVNTLHAVIAGQIMLRHPIHNTLHSSEARHGITTLCLASVYAKN